MDFFAGAALDRDIEHMWHEADFAAVAFVEAMFDVVADLQRRDGADGAVGQADWADVAAPGTA